MKKFAMDKAFANNRHTQENRIVFTEKQQRYLKFKRVADFFIAFFALIVLILPMLAVCIVQKLLSVNEPIFFRQKRVGLGYRVFFIYKFRSMKAIAPNVATADLTHSDMYISKFGRILRNTSIDELPQLINVLKGDMSIIGPRPLIWQEREIRKLRKQQDIYSIRPGITGLAQISGRDLVDNNSKVQLDREYAENIGFKMDMKILLRSVGVVLRHIGIKEGSDADNVTSEGLKQ